MIKKLESVAKHMNLLYVDDNQELCETNLSFFKDIFNEVDFALNGFDALKLYKKRSYDLVITDINMPRVNGFTLIKEIQKFRPEQAVIVVSAYSEIGYLSQLHDCQIEYFLIKPVDTKELMEKIYECISVKETQD